MRYFFKTKRFKIIAAISVVLIATIIICSTVPQVSAPVSNALSTVISPIQSFSSSISKNIDSFFSNFESNKELNKEIKELKKELAEKNYQLADYEDTIRQNEFYKKYLEIKDDNKDYEFSLASVIAKDVNDEYKTFTIDSGTLDGVSVYDPVITDDGIVGYISDAYSTQSTVMTVLNPKINISALDNRSRDSGNITGYMSLATKGYCLMNYISSENTLQAGDYIVSSGEGGLFPKGQIIGTVVEINTNSSKISCEATIQPIADFDEISDVMVVTNFDGKQ